MSQTGAASAVAVGAGVTDINGGSTTGAAVGW